MLRGKNNKKFRHIVKSVVAVELFSVYSLDSCVIIVALVM
jgi:hypothetical protein